MYYFETNLKNLIKEELNDIKRNDIFCYYFFKRISSENKILDEDGLGLSHKKRYFAINKALFEMAHNRKKMVDSLEQNVFIWIKSVIRNIINDWNNLKEKNKWSDSKKKNQLMVWFKNKDKSDADWLIQYFDKNKIELQSKLDETFIQYDSNHLYLNVIYRFITWDVHVDTKRLFLEKMKKSWNQKKYREKVEGKKVLNVYLDEDIKKLLKRACEIEKKTITEMVTYIIQDALKSYKGRNRRTFPRSPEFFLDNSIEFEPQVQIDLDENKIYPFRRKE